MSGNIASPDFEAIKFVVDSFRSRLGSEMWDICQSRGKADEASTAGVNMSGNVKDRGNESRNLAGIHGVNSTYSILRYIKVTVYCTLLGANCPGDVVVWLWKSLASRESEYHGCKCFATVISSSFSMVFSRRYLKR